MVKVYDAAKNIHEIAYQYPFDEHLQNDLSELYLKEGVIINDNNTAICTTETYNLCNTIYHILNKRSELNKLFTE